MEVPFQRKCRVMGARGLMLVQRPIDVLEQTTGLEQTTIPDEALDDARFDEDEAERLGYSFHMDISKMIEELRSERKQVEEAILTLERLAMGRGKRRGRPPAWMKAATESVPKRRGRPPGSKNKATENPSA